MEIETDCETVEVASVLRVPRKLRTCPECGAEFMPRSGSQVCCGDECRTERHRRLCRERNRRARGSSEDCEVVIERAQRMTLDEKRKEKARRRAAFFAARDAAFERAGLPVPKIEVRNGVRIESRGVIAGRPSGRSSLQISSKSYYFHS